MRSDDILEAMTDIRSDYIASAQERLGYLPPRREERANRRRTDRALRRTMLLAAALALLLTVLMATAMAADEGFREKVFTFLRIGQAAVVPDHGGNDGVLTIGPVRIDVGGVLEGSYVHVPSGTARNGLFLVWAGGPGYRYDAYKEENGELVKLEPRSFRQEYTILGQDFVVEFEWVEHDGYWNCTYVPADARFGFYSLDNSIHAALFQLECGQEVDGVYQSSRYPVLIDLETGELTDVLAGTGAEDLDIYLAAVSEDRSRMLLTTYEGALYCADLTAGKLYDVDALSGEHAQACSLIGDTLSCWVLEGDSIENAQFGTYRAWAIDLNTLERREVFRDVPATAATSHDVWSLNWGTQAQDPAGWAAAGKGDLPEPNRAGLTFISGFSTFSQWGNQYSGTRYAVETDADQTVYAVDLTNGARIRIEGFQWPETDYPNIECVPSADGEKVLIRTWANGTFGELGVLDFVKGTYIQFSRENLNDVNEYDAYWFDNDSVVVCASGGGEEYDFYLYRLVD